MSIISAVSATDGSYKPYNLQNLAPSVGDATTVTVNNENPVNKVVAPVGKDQNIKQQKSDEKSVAPNQSSKTDPPPPVKKSEVIGEAIAKSRFEEVVKENKTAEAAVAEANINQEVTLIAQEDAKTKTPLSLEAGRAYSYSKISFTGEVQPEKFNPPVPVTEIKAPSVPLGYVSQNKIQNKSDSDEAEPNVLENNETKTDSIIVNNPKSEAIELVTDKVTYNISEKSDLNYGFVN